MQTKKQFYSYRDVGRENKLSDYVRWCEQKEKQANRALIRTLKKQNEILLRKYSTLKGENKSSLNCAEKKFDQNLRVSQQQDRSFKDDRNYYSVGKKHSADSIALTYQSSQRKFGQIKSARKHGEITRRAEINQFKNESQANLDQTMNVKSRKFEYTKDQQFPELIFNLIQIQKQNNQKAPNYKDIEAIANVPTRKGQPQQINFSENILNQQTTFNKKNLVTQNNRVKELECEVQQLKQIQSKLLNRIQQRDEIIQKLQALLAQNISQRKNDNIRQNDKQTIDSTLSPIKSSQ